MRWAYRLTTRDGTVRMGTLDLGTGWVTFDVTIPPAASTVETDPITGETTRTFTYDDEDQPETVPLGTVWAGPEVQVLASCGECTDACRCSRIGECLRFKCRFGEDSAP